MQKQTLKQKTTYTCQQCGAQYAKHQGKCSSCSAWNTVVEEIISAPAPVASWEVLQTSFTTALPTIPKQLEDISYEAVYRIPCADQELSRTLGGGIVPGSLVLVGGEPGIGKSTLLLQLALQLTHQKILYVSGEESETQIKMRASRLGYTSSNCYIVHETSLALILQHAASLKPTIIIIDSIQTLYTQPIESAPGSVAQVRTATALLMQYAKSTNTAVFLIGHITKEGTLAGPKVLEHMVDTVLQFEGDRHLTYRILRTIKNRFGATPELGIYEMKQAGLQEVANPSDFLLSQREHPLSGIATSAFIEGNRSLLVEVQALVSPATYGTPQRASTGFDGKRLNMLLAVLEKRAGLRLATQDVFLNIAGGMRVEDPALDLAVCAAIYSSLHDKVIPSSYCFAAEVGLGGEVRAINRMEQRITEANRLGFKNFFLSSQNYKALDAKHLPLLIKSIDMVSELMKLVK
jgi:DNA repair protein RadA/Sms